MILPFFHPHRYDPNSLLDTTLLYCTISLILTVHPERSNSLSAALFVSAARYFSATRSGSFFPQRHGFLSVARFSLGGEVFSRQRGFFSAARCSLGGEGVARRLRFSLGVTVFPRHRGFRSASRCLLGSAVFSRGWGYFLARIMVPGCYLSPPGVVCVPFLSISFPLFPLLISKYY